MKNISTYIEENINESILSSTNSGKYAITNDIINFIQSHIPSMFSQKALNEVEIKFENSTPYAILHMSNNKNVDIELENASKNEIDLLQRLSGIYTEYNNELRCASLRFSSSNNLLVDFSRFSKCASYDDDNLQYSIEFSGCKDVSIKALPIDFGNSKELNDEIVISNGSTLKYLPKAMGHSNIYINNWAFTNKNPDLEIDFNVLKGVKCYKLKFDNSYITASDMYPQMMIKCRNGQYRLRQEYNERFEPISNLKFDGKIVCINVLDEYEYAEYDKRVNAYIFNKK